jgi:tetratricopeptide (TPR) repeat protein
MSNEWFRNKTWSEAIAADFENRLQQADEGFRMTALKIQGDNWLGSGDVNTQQAGIRLLEKLIAEYTHEIYEVATVQEILGEYYYKLGNFEKAEIYLLPVLRFYKEHMRVGVVRKADLLLAEIILLRNTTERMEEAWQLINNYSNTGGSLSWDHEEHYYYELLAQVSYRLGKKEEAVASAKKAIAVAETMDADFMISKPTAIEKYYEQLPSLAELAG